MAKRTVLDMVQGLLSITSGDNVNSISDTIEATQFADLLRQCYFDIVDELELPVNRELGNLEGLGDSDLPSVMRLPENVSGVQWIKYDVRDDVSGDKDYADMIYKDPFDFVTYVNNRSSSDADVQVCTITGQVPLMIFTDTRPQFWTSFDDEHIVFDSFNSDVDSSLQTSKSIFYGTARPSFTLEDDFVPDLPENLFSYLYATAEARAFAAFKQDLNPKSEQQEKRSRIRTFRNKWRTHRHNYEGPDFGKR